MHGGFSTRMTASTIKLRPHPPACPLLIYDYLEDRRFTRPSSLYWGFALLILSFIDNSCSPSTISSSPNWLLGWERSNSFFWLLPVSIFTNSCLGDGKRLFPLPLPLPNSLESSSINSNLGLQDLFISGDSLIANLPWWISLSSFSASSSLSISFGPV